MALHPGDADTSSKWSSADPWSEMKHTPGAYPSSPNPRVEQHMADHSSIAAAVKARRHEYIGKQTIKIKVGSWNVASASNAEKDLAGWFVKGHGVKGLFNDLSNLSLDDMGSDTSSSPLSSSLELIEPVEEQEERFKKGKTTLPKHDQAAIASEDDVGLYALGLQEVIDITSVTEAMRPYYDPNPAKKWKHALKRALPAGYVKIAELQLLGLLVLVYAAPSVAPFVSSVDCVSVGTGALGYMGNKGATSVRIVLGGTTRILFVNSHLAAGADKAALERRIWDTNQILQRTKFAPANYDGDILEGVQEQIGDEDFAFWFGDLNYRLDGIPGEDVRRLLLLHTRNEYDILNKSKRRIDSELGYINAAESDTGPKNDQHYEYNAVERSALESSAEPPLDPKEDPASLYTTLQALLAHDQLRAQQKLGKAFHEGWREGEINFLPTYKYDIGSVGMFDSGEKKRSPSWCDRILYRTRQDKKAHDDRVKREQEASSRDAELKSRGIETDVTDQEVLFDYNPEIHGANDYDEYDEDEDIVDEPRPVQTVKGPEDIIKLEDYVSHQRVLSSDHKPLSAVFTLAYDAVKPDLKTKVHAEVTRDFDKNENESRPSITVVVENPPGSVARADEPIGSTELSDVVFQPVRFRVPQVRALTIANTSPMTTTFAFINRPNDSGVQPGPSPPWLVIHVNQNSDAPSKTQEELGASTSFSLEPGDVTTVSIALDVSNIDFVRRLNEGKVVLDDILVLRVLHGRDHFIRVTGQWLPTCFGKSLDELIQNPNGARSVGQGEAERSLAKTLSENPSSRSIPRELFALSDVLPDLVERAIADWAMINAGHDAPWASDASWPFVDYEIWKPQDEDRPSKLSAIRDALETGQDIGNCIDSTTPPVVRVELLAETIELFLTSLKDGIVPPASWTIIEQRLGELEKQKSGPESQDLQEIVLDVLSMTPTHSVSFTFITFMLTRILAELCLETSNPSRSPPLPHGPFHQRTSTQASEISDISSTESTTSATTTTAIAESTRSKLSFLTSFPLRRSSGLPATAPGAGQSGSIHPKIAIDRRAKYIEAYVFRWAPILIRAQQDLTAKGKERKLLDARKQRVLEAFLAGATKS